MCFMNSAQDRLYIIVQSVAVKHSKTQQSQFAVAFQTALCAKELSNLEDTVAAMQADFEKSLCANAASQKELQENLVSAKHDLLRVQEQLSLAEKVVYQVHPTR